ncbi:MAG TPA: hypothetical protein VFS60_07285 [Thermoanaerobaculia bacterium]|nr:hypothetical protein [Thermoanaerobaculia bacterium]
MPATLLAASAASFAGVPAPLRPALAEVDAVRRGLKPACRLTLGIDAALGEALGWLRDAGLAQSLSQPLPEQLGYGPLSTLRRAALLRTPKVRVYLARSAADSRALYRLEAERYDYAAFGLALGYPSCCVEWAAAADRRELEPRSGVWRQTNLTAAGLHASSRLQPACNHLLLESALSTLGPVSAISHYPCRLDCPPSAALGRQVLAMAAERWPIWHAAWIDLLAAPTLYWSDAEWPPELWDEYAGLALIGAHFATPLSWRAAAPALPLGSGLTPAGRLPAGTTWGALAEDGVLLGGDGEWTPIPHAVAGLPRLLDWAGGSIRSPAPGSPPHELAETPW